MSKLSELEPLPYPFLEVLADAQEEAINVEMPATVRTLLIDLGCKFIDLQPLSTAGRSFLGVLWIGAAAGRIYWMEISSSGWTFYSKQVPDDRSKSISSVICDRQVESILPRTEILQQLIDFQKAEVAAELEIGIKYCLGIVQSDKDIHDLSLKARSRIESMLLSLGYEVFWPVEVVYDLDRLKTGMGKCYYIDGSSNLSQVSHGLLIKDLGGRTTMLSNSVAFEISQLTFRSCDELAAESESLVVHHTEVLKGFFYIASRAEPDRKLPIYAEDVDADLLGPMVSENYIAYRFYTPIPSIAQALRPAVEMGGLQI
jgi:hypothetical protein